MDFLQRAWFCFILLPMEYYASIGNQKLESPFLAAPMAGISDSAYRLLCREQGAALVYSEMISAKGLFYNDKNTERLLQFRAEEPPVAYQLFGAEPRIMAMAAERLGSRGNGLLDINMGCPVPKVVKSGEGSALMREPKLAAAVLAAVKAAEGRAAETEGRPPKPVTVKCRAGWDEDSINVVDFARRMEEAGADAIAVHGRTREQYYGGRANWEILQAVKDAVAVPVIGSGDVFSAGAAMAMLKQTGVDFVMIARGALGNPWIFREALALWRGAPLPQRPATAQLLAAIERHLALVSEDKGEKVAVQELRKHVGWYLKGVRGAAQVRRKINSAATRAEIAEALAGICGEEG